MTNYKNYQLKKWTILFLGALVFCSYGCNKDTRERIKGTFETSVTLQAGLNLIETHTFILRNVPTFYTPTLANNGYDISYVDETNAGTGVITTPFWAENLNFFERIIILIKPSGSNVSYKEFFYLDPVPNNRKSPLSLFNGLANQTDALSSDFVDIEIKVKLRSFLPSALRMDIDLGYNIYIKE